VVEPVADPEILARLEEANRRIAALEARDGDEEVIAALVEANNRIMALEARTAEQEMAIRHTLTMLIEWIETEDYQRAAA
jgi:general secretion pathway protein A